MAVRFEPVRDGRKPAQRKDRENLAEVIDLRSKITEITERKETSSQEVLIAATKTLGRRAMSSAELRDALLKREFDEHLVEEVIENFEERRFLDDLSLAETITEKLRTTKKASASVISRKLTERQIPRHLIEQVISTIDREEDHDILYGLALERARKLGSLEPEIAKRRLFGYLQRRGWGGPDVMNAVVRALEEADEADEAE